MGNKPSMIHVNRVSTCKAVQKDNMKLIKIDQEYEKQHQVDEEYNELDIINCFPVCDGSHIKLKNIFFKSFQMKHSINSTSSLFKLKWIKQQLTEWEMEINEYKHIIHNELLSKFQQELCSKYIALRNIKNRQSLNKSVLSHSIMAHYKLLSQAPITSINHNTDKIEQKLNDFVETIVEKEQFDEECKLSIKNIKGHLLVLKKNINLMNQIISHQCLLDFDEKMDKLKSKTAEQELKLLNEWKSWNNAQIIEWIKCIDDNGKFNDNEKYDKLFKEIQNKNIVGKDLININKLFFKGIVLYKRDINILMDYIGLLTTSHPFHHNLHHNKCERNQNEDKNVCVICCESQINTIGIPCMHLCLCWECYQSQQHEINMICPICNVKCNSFRKCYIQGF